MTEQLEKAIERLQALPAEEQDRYAANIATWIEDDLSWDRFCERNLAAIERLGEEAIAEHERGETVPLEDIL